MRAITRPLEIGRAEHFGPSCALHNSTGFRWSVLSLAVPARPRRPMAIAPDSAIPVLSAGRLLAVPNDGEPATDCVRAGSWNRTLGSSGDLERYVALGRRSRTNSRRSGRLPGLRDFPALHFQVGH